MKPHLPTLLLRSLLIATSLFCASHASAAVNITGQGDLTLEGKRYIVDYSGTPVNPGLDWVVCPYPGSYSCNFSNNGHLVFKNNTSSYTAVKIYGYYSLYGGSAITGYFTGDYTATFTNNKSLTFENNSLLITPKDGDATAYYSGYGGAIYLGKTHFIQNGNISFIQNKILGSSIAIASTAGTARGGAIYTADTLLFDRNASISFTNNSIYMEHTDAQGGAIYSQNINFNGQIGSIIFKGNNTTLSASKVWAYQQSSKGGAIYSDNTYSLSKFENNQDITFENNSSLAYTIEKSIGISEGGAIKSLNLSFINNKSLTFKGNSAIAMQGESLGGAISSKDLLLQNNGNLVLETNSAISSEKGSSKGGALYSKGVITITGHNSFTASFNTTSSSQDSAGGFAYTPQDLIISNNANVFLNNNSAVSLGTGSTASGGFAQAGSFTLKDNGDVFAYYNSATAKKGIGVGGFLSMGIGSSLSITNNGNVVFAGNIDNSGRRAFYVVSSTIPTLAANEGKSITFYDGNYFLGGAILNYYKKTNQNKYTTTTGSIVFSGGAYKDISGAGSKAITEFGCDVFLHGGTLSMQRGATLNIDGALNLYGGSTLHYLFDENYTTQTKIISAKNLKFVSSNGTSLITLNLESAVSSGSFILLTNEASTNKGQTSVDPKLFTLSGSAAAYGNIAWIDKNLVFTLTSPPPPPVVEHDSSLIWKGGDGTWSSNADHKPWNSSVGDDYFAQGDTVFFKEGNGSIILEGDMSPQKVVVNGGNYAFVSPPMTTSGSLQGPMVLELWGGSLDICTSNAYTGATTVQNAQLSISHAKALGSSAITLAENSRFNLRDCAIDNDITITGKSTLLYASNYRGYLEMQSGKLFLFQRESNQGGVLSADELYMESGLINGAAIKTPNFYIDSGDVNASILGEGSLTKESDGIAYLNGYVGHTGDTYITGGELVIQSPFDLQSKSIKITGEGVLSIRNTLSLKDGQSLAAGHMRSSNKSWDIKGNVALYSGGKIRIEQERLSISGNLSLNGGSLQFGSKNSIHIGGTLSLAGNTTLETSSKLAQGSYSLFTFTQLEGSTDLLSLSNLDKTEYYWDTTTAGVLTLIVGKPSPVALLAALNTEEEISATPPEEAPKVALTEEKESANSAPNSSESPLNLASETTAPVAALSAPPQLPAFNQNALWVTHYQMNSFADTMRSNGQGALSGIYTDSEGKSTLWISSLSNFFSMESSGSVGHKAQSNGYMMGVDVKVHNQVKLGLSVGQSWTRTTLNQHWGGLDQSLFVTGLYSEISFLETETDSVYLSLGALQGQDDNKANVAGGQADYLTKSYVFESRLNWHHKLSTNTALYSGFGLQWSDSQQAAFDFEELSYNRTSLGTLKAHLSVGLSQKFTDKWQGYVNLAFAPDLVRQAPHGGPQPGRLGMESSMGTLYQFTSQWSASLSYQYNLTEHAQQQSINAGISYSF